jgi:DNA-binding beta-propeller fold protein YncE
MKARKVVSLFCLLAFVMLTACKKDEAKVTTPYVYFTDTYDELIQKMSLDDSLKISTVLNVVDMSGVGLAYDKIHNKMYLADFFDEDTPNGRIWKMNLDGTDTVAIVTGILNPYGIAVDPKGGKIYWGDELGNVSRANLDGTSKETSLINIPDGLIRSISLDVENNKMYFFDVEHDNLYVANLDGTSKSVLMTGVYGYCLFVDTKNDKLYFDDEYETALMRSNLDGTDVIEIYKNPDATPARSRVYGIDINYTTNKLIWSCRDAGEIYMSNLNGTEKVTLATGLSSPRQLFLKN